MALEASWSVDSALQQLQNMPSDSDQLARMAGLPGNPLGPPGSPARKVADAAMGQVKKTAKKVGVDILKKVGKGVVTAAVGTGTTFSVGASIGSAIPIPGIGTAIGVIGAAIFEGFKKLFEFIGKRIRARRAKRAGTGPCPKYKCPEPPKMMNAVELLAWAASASIPVARDAIKDQYKKVDGHWKSVCGHGGAPDCISQLRDLMGNVASKSEDSQGLVGVVLKTIPEMGLPQIERYLPLYRSSPIGYPYFNDREKKVVWENSVYEPILVCIGAMEKRKTELVALMGRIQGIPQIAPGQMSTLGWDLGKELTKAATQAQLAPGPETLGWFRTLGDAGLKLQAAEAALNEAMRKHSEVTKQRAGEVAKDPAKARSLLITQLQFLCNDAGGRGPKCDELKKLLAGGTVAPGRPAAPARAPARARGRVAPAAPVTTSQQQQQVRQISQAQDQYVSEYLQWLADTGNPAAKQMQAEKDRQPGVTTYLYLDRKAKAGDQNAKIVLFAAVKEFQASL